MPVAEASDLDAARRRPFDGGSDRVVDEVAEHGGHILHLDQVRQQQRLRVDGDPYAALSRLETVRADEGVQQAVADAIDVLDRVVDGPAMQLLAEELASLARAVGVEHADGDVEAVRELMPLHTQCPGHGPHGVQSFAERGDVRAIADDQHGAEVPPGVTHGLRVGIEHPVAHDHRLTRGAVSSRGDDRGGDAQLLQRRARGVAEVQHPPRRIVAEAHDAAVVQRHDPVADAVEDGGLVLHQGDELFRLQTQREPLPPSSQHDRGDRCQQHAGAGRCGDAAEQRRQVVEHAGGFEAHAHLADRGGTRGVGAVGARGPDGHLRTRRDAERALLPCHDLVAGEHLAEVGADGPAEQRGIGMRQTDAVVVGDHDEEGAGVRGDIGGQFLQRTARQIRAAGCAGIGADLGDLGAHLRVDGDRAGDVQRGGLGRCPQLLDAQKYKDENAHGDDRDHRGQLHEHHPRREPHLVSIMR